MNIEKENFLRTRFISLLQKLNPATTPGWGKMNVQQMIEHFANAVMNASGKLKLPEINKGEQLEKFRQFLFSEKPFKENTKNPLMAEEPEPLKCNTVQAAIGKLQSELIYFFEVFEKDQDFKTINPFFGELDFNGNVQLLHKHAVHHLKQFGVEVL
jgi:hypothetical protein